LGVVRAIQKHWQSSLQPSLQRRCRVRRNKDHSIANNVMQPAYGIIQYAMQAQMVFAKKIMAVNWRGVGSQSAGEV